VKSESVSRRSDAQGFSLQRDDDHKLAIAYLREGGWHTNPANFTGLSPAGSTDGSYITKFIHQQWHLWGDRNE
jgi:hypothetical protein